VGPVRVVMLDVLDKHCFQVTAPRMSIRSRHSRRMVPITRSQTAFARGDRAGLFTALVPSTANTESKDAVNFSLRSDEELDSVHLFAELYGNIAGLLSDPAGDRVGRDPGNPNTSRVVMDEHEDVEPAEEHRVDIASRTPSARSPVRQGAPPRSARTCAAKALRRDASGSPRRSRGRPRCPRWLALLGSAGSPTSGSPSPTGG
jgi:hypothetical protein